MRVLVTGSDGYIGAVLGPYLLARGLDVVGLDTGYYRDGWLFSAGSTRYPACIAKDIRAVDGRDLAGFDAIVHLAELSNDPLGQHNPETTFAINHRGTVHLAEQARAAGVSRFVYTSSCSVYGVGSGDEVKTETSEPKPQTAYAECKVLVERDLTAMAGDDFTPTFLRNATAFGPSPRMRFDIVVNNLSGLAWTTHEIRMTSDGTPWRPLVHVEDICQAIACTLAAAPAAVATQVLNVGDTEANYQVRDVAAIVGRTFPGCSVTLGSQDGDNRSYRVSFDKIRRVLPDFRCRHDVEAGARQLHALFERIAMSAERFGFRAFTRLKQLEYLLRTGQLDAAGLWTDRAA